MLPAPASAWDALGRSAAARGIAPYIMSVPHSPGGSGLDLVASGGAVGHPCVAAASWYLLPEPYETRQYKTRKKVKKKYKRETKQCRTKTPQGQKTPGQNAVQNALVQIAAGTEKPVVADV
eukprot:2310613-Rhodomonas_salina.1